MNQIFIIILMFLTACGGNKNIETNRITNEEQTFLLTDSTYVIFEYDSAEHWFFENSIPTSLSDIELIEIEKIIDNAIYLHNKKESERLAKINSKNPKNQMTETGSELHKEGFMRQYVPVINVKGEKEVWINFFCFDWNSDYWKSKIMIVDDGGNCFYNIKVNLKSKTFYDLRINGNA